jgi:farnesyl diphosphate synthase
MPPAADACNPDAMDAALFDVPSKLPRKMSSKFAERYGEVRAMATDSLREYGCDEVTVAYFTHMFDYNVPKGKLARGATVVDCVELVSGFYGREVTPELELQAHVLGWCVEWLQAFFLVIDDIMDHSVTRRGQPCWYKVERVGFNAANDALLLEMVIYGLLKRHFRGHRLYVELIELFHQVTTRTIIGQHLDSQYDAIVRGDHIDFSKYTLDRYRAIVRNKTAHYTFVLPIQLGLVLCGVGDAELLETSQRLCLSIGELFQIQDDFLDCFGDPSATGKVGTDIEDAKCSWLVLYALGVASPEQRQQLHRHYGKQDAASIQEVKRVFGELAVADAYIQHEESAFTKLQGEIVAAPAMLQPLFSTVLAKMFKRST